jgi:hypothetical protein
MSSADQVEGGCFLTEAITFICSIAEAGEFADFAQVHCRRWSVGLIVRFYSLKMTTAVCELCDWVATTLNVKSKPHDGLGFLDYTVDEYWSNRRMEVCKKGCQIHLDGIESIECLEMASCPWMQLGLAKAGGL